MSAPVAPVLPGEKMAGGKYRVDRILGHGGMGVVVGAKHIELDERVAIKFLLGDPSPAAVDRFLREARAAVKVKGEHVCRVLDFGRLETGEPYIVMEYLEGTDLSKLLEQSGAQQPAAAVGWIVEACDALVEAHSLGIVHRDIKPANIFLAKRGDATTIAKVLDFGISKLPSQATQMTAPQTVMGSPAYMSPEQMESARDVDGRTDVWSVGVTLYELLSGKPPFRADSMVQLTMFVREREPPTLENVPEGLSAVVRRCLAKDPAKRYQTIGELIGDLAPFAPEEVFGLVRRHARRGASSVVPAALASPALEIRSPAERLDSPRVDHDERRFEATESRLEKVDQKAGGTGKGTFAPLQSSLNHNSADAEAKRRSSIKLAIGAISIGALVVAIALASPATTSLPAPPPSSPEVETSVGKAPSKSPAGSAETPSQQPSATASASERTSAKSSPPARPQNAKPKDATSPPAEMTGSAPAEAAKPPSGVEATASTASASATAAKPEPKKRRDLDRDDP